MSSRFMLRRPGLGLLIASLYVLAALTASVPARATLAAHQARFGLPGWQTAAAGLLVDVRDGLFAFAAASVLVGLVLWLPSRRLCISPPVIIRNAALAGMAPMFLFLLLGWLAAAEFKIERGLYPTLFDLTVGLNDSAYATSALHMYLRLGVLVPVVAASLICGSASYVFVRWSSRASLGSWRRELGISGASLILVGVAAFAAHRAAPLVVRSIPNWRVVESPSLTFFRSFGGEHENVRLGFLGLLRSIDLPEGEVAGGASLFGWPESSPDRLRATRSERGCEGHPLAVPLTPATAREATVGELRSRYLELSRLLFGGASRPVHVWHVSLESFRGYDVNALNDKAPRELTPFVTSRYEDATTAAPHTIAAKWMYMAGTRTSQGLAAQLCGTGTMAWGLSLVRDVGLLPLRCLPDLLKDAGFSTGFYYGSNPGFDNMQTFLSYHGFDRMMTEREYIERVPHRGWSVPDAIVFEQALADAQTRGIDRSQYNFVMTLTNHHPFDRPEDFPAEVGERVRRGIDASHAKVGDEDLHRLETLSYTDYAVEELARRIEASPAADRSIIVASADHATGNPFGWADTDQLDDRERLLGLTRIPFFIVFPDALLDRGSDPARERALLGEIDTLLATKPISQNDIPLMIVDLLSASSELSSLPEPWRWHTLGGQAWTPSFAVTGQPNVAVIGVDSWTRVFEVTNDNAFLPIEQEAALPQDTEQAKRVAPSLLPTAALLSRFVRGYANQCWDSSNIRSRP